MRYSYARLACPRELASIRTYEREREREKEKEKEKEREREGEREREEREREREGERERGAERERHREPRAYCLQKAYIRSILRVSARELHTEDDAHLLTNSR